MNNLEAGGVRHRALESGVLIAADNERIDILLAHRAANIVEAALNFFWTGHKH